MTQFNIAQYDQKIMNPGIQRLYEYSGYYNVGDWSQQPASIPEACRQMVMRHVKPLSSLLDARILDAGCGLGAGTSLMGQYYADAQVTGINISEQQLIHARSKNTNPRVDFQMMDAAALTFEDQTFDQIISVEAAFHFNTREAFIQEAYRVLKPGGTLTFTDILFHSTEAVGDWSVPAANRIVDLETYRRICVAPGFVVDEQKDITNVSWHAFCNHVGKFPGMKVLAEKLQASVAAYLITGLRKPS